jgi:hypothetical protein
LATSANPLASGGAAPGGQPQNPNLAAIMGALSSKTSSPGKDLSAQFGEMQGADPTMVLRQLEQISQALAVLYVKTFQNQPNLAGQIQSASKQLTRCLKEAQKGSETSEVVGRVEGNQPPPISFSPAQQGDNSSPSMSTAAAGQ